MANSKEKISSPEEPPKLSAVEVKRKIQPTIQEAMQGVKGTPGGRDEIKWILKNPEKAAKMLKGGAYYIFPGTVTEAENKKHNAVSYLYSAPRSDAFRENSTSVVFGWHKSCRVVIKE